MALEDISVVEKDKALLNVALTKPRSVKWMKENELIAASDDKFEQHSSSDGLEHSLTICSCSLNDSGVFAVHINDGEYGTITSSGNVIVKGLTMQNCISFIFHI